MQDNAPSHGFKYFVWLVNQDIEDEKLRTMTLFPPDLNSIKHVCTVLKQIYREEEKHYFDF